MRTHCLPTRLAIETFINKILHISNFPIHMLFINFLLLLMLNFFVQMIKWCLLSNRLLWFVLQIFFHSIHFSIQKRGFELIENEIVWIFWWTFSEFRETHNYFNSIIKRVNGKYCYLLRKEWSVNGMKWGKWKKRVANCHWLVIVYVFCSFFHYYFFVHNNQRWEKAESMI